MSTAELTVKGIKYTVNIGDKFNRLKIQEFTTVQEKSGGRIVNRTACICECNCGNKVGPISLRRVVSGNDKSCGCLDHERLLERNTKHGCKKRNSERDQLYDCWVEMHRRCRDEHRKSATSYVLKGIRVCDEWNEFLPFKNWAINNGYRLGLSIERKNNSDGYNPNNCTWIPLSDQCKNKTTNVYLNYNGEVHYITEWCRLLGINRSTVQNRLNKGWSVGKALGLE